MTQPGTITAEQLARRETIELIDVRTPAEFGEVHAPMAVNVPLDTLDPCELMTGRTCTSDAPVFVICKGGMRSAKAQQKLISAGYADVINVEGGTDAWISAGLPVVRGRKAISLERQVRITAGLITLSGAILAMVTGNVYFAGIPAFIGAGLMFAGITDTCGMGMVLAKMPWNR